MADVGGGARKGVQVAEARFAGDDAQPADSRGTVPRSMRDDAAIEAAVVGRHEQRGVAGQTGDQPFDHSPVAGAASAHSRRGDAVHVGRGVDPGV